MSNRRPLAAVLLAITVLAVCSPPTSAALSGVKSGYIDPIKKNYNEPYNEQNAREVLKRKLEQELAQKEDREKFDNALQNTSPTRTIQVLPDLPKLLVRAPLDSKWDNHFRSFGNELLNHSLNLPINKEKIAVVLSLPKTDALTESRYKSEIPNAISQRGTFVTKLLDRYLDAIDETDPAFWPTVAEQHLKQLEGFFIVLIAHRDPKTGLIQYRSSTGLKKRNVDARALEIGLKAVGGLIVVSACRSAESASVGAKDDLNSYEAVGDVARGLASIQKLENPTLRPFVRELTAAMEFIVDLHRFQDNRIAYVKGGGEGFITIPSAAVLASPGSTAEGDQSAHSTFNFDAKRARNLQLEIGCPKAAPIFFLVSENYRLVCLLSFVVLFCTRLVQVSEDDTDGSQFAYEVVFKAMLDAIGTFVLLLCLAIADADLSVGKTSFPLFVALCSFGLALWGLRRLRFGLPLWGLGLLRPDVVIGSIMLSLGGLAIIIICMRIGIQVGCR